MTDPADMTCEAHRGEESVNWEDRSTWAHCPMCGCMIATYRCKSCGKDYVEWGPGGDDIMRGAAASTDGDFGCWECIQQWEADRHELDAEPWEADEDDAYEFDPLDQLLADAWSSQKGEPAQ